MSNSRKTTSSLALDAQKAAAQVRKQPKPLKVGRKTRAAIDLMVFRGKTRTEAADEIGMSDIALRAALRLQHVLAYLNEQMEVLRTSARPKALGKIVDLIDGEKTPHRVALDAAKYIDGMDRTVHQAGAQQVNVNVGVKVETAGYVIDLSEYPAGAQQQIDHLEATNSKPLPRNADVPEDE